MVTKKNEPKWSIAGKYDKGMNKTGGPSPDAYDLPSKIVERPGITIGSRLKSALDTSTGFNPGPGTYSPDKKDKQFSFSMGMRYKQMDASIREGVPGPGQYELGGKN
mmetsp:Transcript_41079/g.30215  ORF Transcript_41079/g.30215 Transcript_41079/m.30215 type:complete len:107 (+) Transcript_41079:109-429(+)